MFWRSLRFRLLLGLIFLSLIGLLVFAFMVQRRSVTAFQDYLLQERLDDLEEAAIQQYRVNGDLQGLAAAFLPPHIRALRNAQSGSPRLPNSPASSRPNSQPNPSTDSGTIRPSNPNSALPPRTLPDGTALPERLIAVLSIDNKVLIPLKGLKIGQTVDPDSFKGKRDIIVEGEKAGTLVYTDTKGVITTEATAFVSTVNRSLGMAGLVALLMALILGIPLIEGLLHSLRRLGKASETLAQGSLGYQVEVTGNTEVQQLARSFNTMSLRLAELNQQRKQMTADIAHDLGTPLAVVSGYVQSLKNKQLEPTQERFAVMEEELLNMERLLEDMRILSTVEAGQLSLKRSESSPEFLLASVKRSFADAARASGVLLDTKIEPALPSLNVDLELMKRVFANLVSNALRYTPAGGKVYLKAEQAQDGLVLEVTDTGEGVAQEQLSHLFERHYSADESRSDARSGLGLAIAKSIVDLHEGHISARSTQGEGMTIRMWFPC